MLKLCRMLGYSMFLHIIDKIFKSGKDEIFKSETLYPDMIRISSLRISKEEYCQIPTYPKGILTVEEKVSKLKSLAETKSRVRDLILQKKKKLDESISAIENMKMKRSAPKKLILKAMLIVIHRLLNKEGKISIEKAKKHTADIAKEYLINRGFSEFANLDYKDVDNALHHS